MRLYCSVLPFRKCFRLNVAFYLILWNYSSFVMVQMETILNYTRRTLVFFLMTPENLLIRTERFYFFTFNDLFPLAGIFFCFVQIISLGYSACHFIPSIFVFNAVFCALSILFNALAKTKWDIDMMLIRPFDYCFVCIAQNAWVKSGIPYALHSVPHQTCVNRHISWAFCSFISHFISGFS